MLAIQSIVSRKQQGTNMSQESNTGRKRLNDDRLKVGDIVLTTSRGLVSKTIRTVTRSDISHAMV